MATMKEKNFEELSDLFVEQRFDVLKAIQKIWINRRVASTVDAVAWELCRQSKHREVFNSIEFYLPQLVHLTIHLGETLRCEPLEVLLIIIAQTSIHCALQLCFLMVAALEDYQPELPTGDKNPTANYFYFQRCARLLMEVETAVSYGDEEALEEGIISDVRIARIRRKLSQVSISSTVAATASLNLGKSDPARNSGSGGVSTSSSKSGRMGDESVGLNGYLQFKRNLRKSMLASKGWKTRFFTVENRMLLCFRDASDVEPIRAFPLVNCRVRQCETSEKYGNTLLEISSLVGESRFQLRAETEADRNRWMRGLQAVIDGYVWDGQTTLTSDSAANLNAQDPSPDTLGLVPFHRLGNGSVSIRSLYFRQLRDFVTNMTNICESLRFIPRESRRVTLQREMRELHVPPFAYLPLCNSTDEYATIRRAVASRAHAFSTKARVPCLMLFEIEKHPNGADLVHFLNGELPQYPMDEVCCPPGCGGVVAKFSAEDFEKAERALAAVEANADIAADEIMRGQRVSVSMPQRSPSVEDLASSMASHTGDSRKQHSETVFHAEVQTANGGPWKCESSRKPATEFAQTDTSNATVLGSSFANTAHEVRRESNLGPLSGWSLSGLIAKSNDDVRQEVFVMQLISYLRHVFMSSGQRLWMHSYRILSTSKSTGLIELIPNATSLDGLKSMPNWPGSLRRWFEMSFGFTGNRGSDVRFEAAMEAFVSSLAAYSIVSYVLAIKDRHNGNIMITKDGHLVHIDFGFVFGFAPGKAFSMEKAPFKLTNEYIEVMGGTQSSWYNAYRERCVAALSLVQDHATQLCAMVEVMRFHSNYPAFMYNSNALADMRARLHLNVPKHQLPKFVDELIGRSANHFGTNLYDDFQVATNGIKK